MGFYAAELEQFLATRTQHQASPWSVLSRMGMHPQQIDRLKKAAEEPVNVSAAPKEFQRRMRDELQITPAEWYRLMAALEADVTLRICLYYGYDTDTAMNLANVEFACVLKDRIAQGDLALPSELADAMDTTMLAAADPRRGRGIRRRVEPQS